MIGLATEANAGAVVRAATNGLPEMVAATMPSETAMKKTVQYARKKAGIDIPGAPQTINGWDVPQNLQFLEDGSRFLQWDSGRDDPERILIFATDAMIRRLKDWRHFFSDGVFKNIPVFEQLYSVHVEMVGLHTYTFVQ